MQRRSRHRLRAWGLAVGWAALIFWGSTGALSSENTARFILPILHWLLPHASSQLLDKLHSLVRKTGHVSEYFVLSLFLLDAIRGGKRGWKLRWAVAALVIAAGYSALDEFHQSFVPGRGPSPWDSLLDTCSAAAAQIFSWAWIRIRRSAPSAEDRPGTVSS